MPETQALEIQHQEMPIGELKAKISRLRQAVDTLMVPGTHYGTIPGTGKLSILKPGAELLCEFYKLAPTIRIVTQHEDLEKGQFSYTIKVLLVSKVDGTTVSEGIGAANSQEKRFARTVEKTKDPGAMQNNIIKQAKKRALIDAVLAATRSSGILDEPDDRLTGTKRPKKPAAKKNAITAAQAKKMANKAKELRITPEGMQEMFSRNFGVYEARDLTKEQAAQTIAELDQMIEEKKRDAEAAAAENKADDEPADAEIEEADVDEDD